jgi:membrane-associated phospholipid phosphatase
MSRSPVPQSADGRVAIGVTAVAFVILAVLVWVGALAPIDQYAVDHWMPSFQPSNGSTTSDLAHQFYPHLGNSLQAFCNLWTFPASGVISGALVAVGCGVLARRGQPAAGLAWAAAWVVANLAEVVGKHFLHRPALHAMLNGMRVSFGSFDHSFPSGHALRAVVTATVLATVWRRAALPALLWTLVTLPALVVGAAHTPSDVVGGVLVALLVILPARAYVRDRAAVA